jgi:hypothetical protein
MAPSRKPSVPESSSSRPARSNMLSKARAKLPPRLTRLTPSEKSVGASMALASPATTLSGPGTAAARRRIVSSSTRQEQRRSPPRIRSTGWLARRFRRRRLLSCWRNRCPCGRSARRCRLAPQPGRPRPGRPPRRCRTARPRWHPRYSRRPRRASPPGLRCCPPRRPCRRSRLQGPRSPARSRQPQCDRRARASCRGPTHLRPGRRRTRRCQHSSWRWPESRPARGCEQTPHPRRWGVRIRGQCVGQGGRMRWRSRFLYP